MRELNQERAPIYEALRDFFKKEGGALLTCRDINGQGQPGASGASGRKMRGYGCELHETSGQPLPSGVVIREAEELAAEAFGAAHAFLW